MHHICLMGFSCELKVRHGGRDEKSVKGDRRCVRADELTTQQEREKKVVCRTWTPQPF